MMTRLLMIREQMKKLYASYGAYLRPLLRFAGMITAIILINDNVGAMSLLKNPAVVFIAGLLGALLPLRFMTVLIVVIILCHMYAIALELAAMVFLVMLVMYLLFFRFTPGDGAALMLVPLLFFINIPYVAPLTVGMVCTPFSVISVSFGVIIFFILNYISVNFELITAAAADDGLGQMTKIFTEVFTSKGMYLTIIAFALVVIVVYFVKRLSVDNSWVIAIISGGVLCIVIMLIGSLSFDLNEVVSVTAVIVGGIISILLALAFKFFIHSVDYSRTEYTQFEDDDFYYYVKAVPKIKVTTPEVNVKRINARKVKTPEKPKASGRERAKEPEGQKAQERSRTPEGQKTQERSRTTEGQKTQERSRTTEGQKTQERSRTPEGQGAQKRPKASNRVQTAERPIGTVKKSR